jgi:hypothetical protein
MPGVSVRVLHSEIQDGLRVTRQDRQVTTDDQGEYRMWNFSPGDYYIAAAGRSGGTAVVVGPAPAGGLAHEGFEPVYYPAAKNRTSATVISLAAGQEFEANLKIHMQPACRVRGTLRNVTPYQPVTVELVRGAGEVSANRVTVNGATGRFEANDVVPGTYRLRAVQKIGDKEIRGEQEIRVELANLDGIVVELLPGVTVSGAVHGWERGALPAEGLVPRRTQVTLFPTEDIGPVYWQFHAMVDEQEKFAIENVPPGRYRLDIASFGTYIASATSGASDVLRDGLVVGQATSPEPIEVVLRNDGGTISGKVEAGQGAWVLLVPTGGGEPQRVQAGLGLFELGGLRPGDYEVFAIKDMDKLEFRNPDVIRALRGGEKVHVSAGATSAVILKGFAQ